MKLVKLVAALALVTVMGSALAAPITVYFTGVQYSNPNLDNGATNFLNLSERDVVHGSFDLDLNGLIDQRSSDPMSGFYSAHNTGPIKRFEFQSVTTSQPFHSIGIVGGYDSYNIEASNNFISVYANNLFETSTGVTSDVFTVSFAFKPGILGNDSYDISQLSSSDLVNLGFPWTSSRYTFMRTENIFGGSGGGSAQYNGYLSDVSVTVSPVPAPPAFILMLTGLGLLGLTKRFRKVDKAA